MLGAGEGRGVRQAQHPTEDLLPARFRVPPTECSGADQVAVHAAFSVTELSVLIARRTAASGGIVERHVSQGADSEEGDLCRQEVWERLCARSERTAERRLAVLPAGIGFGRRGPEPVVSSCEQNGNLPFACGHWLWATRPRAGCEQNGNLPFCLRASALGDAAQSRLRAVVSGEAVCSRRERGGRQIFCRAPHTHFYRRAERRFRP